MSWLYLNPAATIPLGGQGQVQSIAVQSDISLGTLASSGVVHSNHITADIPFSLNNQQAREWPYDAYTESNWTLFVTQFTENVTMVIRVPSIKGAMTGIIEETGILRAEIPSVRFDLTGTIDETGILSVRIPRLTGSFTGIIDNIGTLTVRIPRIRMSGSIDVYPMGTLAVVIPALRMSMDGIVSAFGILDVSIPSLRMSASGFAATDGIWTVENSMVMNIRNFALTLFQNYNFNSLCRFNGRHLGATETGIYDLDDGDENDAGTVIEWNFKTGYLDLHQKQKKRLKYIWFSNKSNGDIVVTVHTTDGNAYEYSLEAVDIYEDGVRVKIGKGIKNKYVAIDVSDFDGSTLDLDAVKLMFENIPLPR